MEKTTGYKVEITRSAELYCFEILDHVYENSSIGIASQKANGLYEEAFTFDVSPGQGQIEENLKDLPQSHRYILYHATSRQTVKIIYFIDQKNTMVYVTDFFPTAMDNERLMKRNK